MILVCISSDSSHNSINRSSNHITYNHDVIIISSSSSINSFTCESITVPGPRGCVDCLVSSSYMFICQTNCMYIYIYIYTYIYVDLYTTIYIYILLYPVVLFMYEYISFLVYSFIHARFIPSTVPSLPSFLCSVTAPAPQLCKCYVRKVNFHTKNCRTKNL